MKQKLTEKLYEKYPAIFALRCEIEHDDGWYGIIANHGMVHYAGILSSKVCEATGKAGELHTPDGQHFGWRRTFNREFAQSDPFCTSHNYLPLSDMKQTQDPL